MKKALIILGVVAGVILLGVAAVFMATAGAVDTADAFFRSVAEGDMDKARTYLAEGFTSSTSDEELEAFLKSSGLNDYRESDWGGRSIDTSSGKITGKVITNSGGTIPLTLTFVKEDGAWKIYYIQKEGAGLNASVAEEVALPSRADAAELVRATTLAFADAVDARDLTRFHADTAPQFQKEISVEQLAQNFSGFLEQEIDLSILKNYEPMFTAEPALSASGILRLEGYYPTQPSRARFSYTYEHIEGDWKLLGISFNLSPVEE